MNADERTRTLIAVLDWYRAMGVDAATDHESVDWLASARAPGAGFALSAAAPLPAEPRPASVPAGTRSAGSPIGTRSAAAPLEARPTSAHQRPAERDAPERRFPTATPDAAVTAARAGARQAGSLAELEQALRAFDGCALKATAKNLCFYRGADAARLMLIGEAPGREEDIEGRPFVGRAGKLLDRMLGAAAIADGEVHITNIIYWRPPGNRTPTPQEAQVCHPFLERQIELVRPEVVLLLGGAAAKQVLGLADGIMKIRGRVRELQVGRHTCKAIATLHPAYLLRTPAAKRLAWRDLLAATELIGKWAR